MQKFRASPDCFIAKIELQVLPHQNQERSILKCLPAQGETLYIEIFMYIYIYVCVSQMPKVKWRDFLFKLMGALPQVLP